MNIELTLVKMVNSRKQVIATSLIIAISILSISLLTSSKVFAGGGVGGGGNASGGPSGGGGYSTRNGHGWMVYDINGPGPSGGFRSGSTWGGVQSVCRGANAGSVMIFGIANGAGSIRGYNYVQDYSTGLYPAGTSVDFGRATVVPSSWARIAFDRLPSEGVDTSGYVFGGSNGNVAWFCTGINPARHDPTGSAVVSCDGGFQGWALDADNLFAQLGIAIVIKKPSETWSSSNYSIRTTGNQPIPSPPFDTGALAAFGVGGDRGFSVPIPDQFKDGSSYDWIVIAANATGTPGNPLGIATIGQGSASWNCSPPVSGDISVFVDCSNLNTAVFTFTKSGTIADQNVRSSVTASGGGSVATNVPATIGNSNFGAGSRVTYSSDPITLQPGQKYTMSVSVSPGGDDATNNSASCESQVKATRPYFRVYGHDVVVGRRFVDPSGVCSPKTSGSDSSDVKAFTMGNGSNTVGAGSQFAVSATGAIEGFMSASMHSGNTDGDEVPKPQNGLSFLNSGNDPSTLIGNDQNAYLGCVPDYESYVNSDGGFSSFLLGSIQSYLNSHDNKLYVNGDLTISGNIEDNTTSWSSIEDINPIIVIVKGNINIASNVSRLDGLYVAIPKSDGSDGEINTCYDLSMSCVNKLTVNGAFVAKKVKLNRLNGDVARAGANELTDSNNIAEVFNFPTEFYLGLKFNINQPPTPTANTKKYDTLVGLPPVL